MTFSTVTVHFAYGLCELHDFTSTRPEDLISVFATAATNVAQVGTGLWLLGRRADPRYKTSEKEHDTLLICPEHAQIFAREGWGRERIQEAMYPRGLHAVPDADAEQGVTRDGRLAPRARLDV